MIYRKLYDLAKRKAELLGAELILADDYKNVAELNGLAKKRSYIYVSESKTENSISILLEVTARAADIMSAEISFLPHKLPGVSAPGYCRGSSPGFFPGFFAFEKG